MNFIEKLEVLMKEKGITRMGLAKKSGVPYTTIVNFYEKGTENIKLSTLKRLSDFFDVSLDFLVDDDELNRITTYMELINVPIVGKVSCGNGELAFEEIEGYEPTPREWLNSGDHFYLRAKGDSMIGARIYNGDLLLIRKQPEVEDGEIAVVIVDNEAVLKKVFKRNGTIILQSENADYSPIVYTNGDIQIVGKLKKVIINY